MPGFTIARDELGPSPCRDLGMTRPVVEAAGHHTGRVGWRGVLRAGPPVDGAELQNGLLHVALKRVVPESLKPRKIAIGTGPAKLTEVNTQAKAA